MRSDDDRNDSGDDRSAEHAPTSNRDRVQTPPGDNHPAGEAPPAPESPRPPATPPRIVRQSNDLSYVHYAPPSAPEGLDRAAYVHSGPSSLSASRLGTHDGGAQIRLGLLVDRQPSRVSILLAVALSIVLPGAGHWYLGRRRLGGALTGLTAVAWAVGLSAGVLGLIVLMGVLPLLAIVCAVWTGLTAHQLDHRNR